MQMMRSACRGIDHWTQGWARSTRSLFWLVRGSVNAAQPELDEDLLREILKDLVHFLDKSDVDTSEVITQLLTAPQRGSCDPAGWPHGSTQLRTFSGNRCGPGTLVRLRWCVWKLLVMKMRSPVCIMHECFVLHPKADELLLQVSALFPSCCSSWRAASMFNAGL